MFLSHGKIDVLKASPSSKNPVSFPLGPVTLFAKIYQIPIPSLPAALFSVTTVKGDVIQKVAGCLSDGIVGPA